MIILENIFKAQCIMGMREFDLEKFKSDFPSLYACVIASLGVAYATALKETKSGVNMIDPMEIKERFKNLN